MARKMIDISIVGDKQLQRALNALKTTAARKIVSPACRASAKRMKPVLAAAAPRDTGNLAAAMAQAKVRSASNRRNMIRIGVLMPTREELGIPQDAGGKRYGYYPMILEYGDAGRGRAPMRWIRNATDSATALEHKRLRLAIINGITTEFKKRTRRRVT